MDQDRNKGAAMEELGGSTSLSTLSASAVNKFKKELEKTGVVLIPELETILRKCIDESYYEIHSSKASALTEDVGTTRPGFEQSPQATLPPLVFKFDWNCVMMAMMRNGQPEVVKNEKGLESTPAFAGFTADKTFIYGTDAETYCESREPELCLRDFWGDCQPDQPIQTVDLKGFGIFKLPRLFYVASFIRKLKITAEESQCEGGLCQAAILAVRMPTTCAQRLRLKEATLLAGFEDVYLINAEGLAAYYWFHKNETERKQNNYSKDFVIIELFGNAVVYKRSLEAGTDGIKNLVVTPIASLNKLMFYRFRTIQEQNEIHAQIRKTIEIPKTDVIPVVGVHRSMISLAVKKLCKNKIVIVDEDEDHSKYFAAKGAALLSENPENIGRHVRSMMTEPVKIEPDIYTITRHDQILSETFAQRTFNIEHDRTKYRISQIKETVGYLIINGVDLGSILKVTYELSWEGIWKVVGVSAKNPSEDDEGYKAVSWEWLIGENVDFGQFGSSSHEDCKSLLLKILPSPSQAKVASNQGDSSVGLPPQALNEAVEASASIRSSGDGNGKGKMLATKSRVTQPNDINRFKEQDKPLKRALPSTSQVKRRSARLTKVGATTSGFGISQDQSVGLGTSTTDTGDGNGMQGKKRCRKGRVLCRNDIIVNPHLKKIKLESDWVEPVVKIEQGSVDGFGEDGKGHQVNFVEHEIKNDEDVVKIEVD